MCVTDVSTSLIRYFNSLYPLLPSLALRVRSRPGLVGRAGNSRRNGKATDELNLKQFILFVLQRYETLSVKNIAKQANFFTEIDTTSQRRVVSLKSIKGRVFNLACSHPQGVREIFLGVSGC